MLVGNIFIISKYNIVPIYCSYMYGFRTFPAHFLTHPAYLDLQEFDHYPRSFSKYIWFLWGCLQRDGRVV